MTANCLRPPGFAHVDQKRLAQRVIARSKAPRYLDEFAPAQVQRYRLDLEIAGIEDQLTGVRIETFHSQLHRAGKRFTFKIDAQREIRMAYAELRNICEGMNIGLRERSPPGPA